MWDILTKAAVTWFIREGIPDTIAIAGQKLPKSKPVLVYYNRGKLSSESGDDIKYRKYAGWKTLSSILHN
eukprot:scaffold21338_cov24-Cyclotella_meneghiniana.AAC.2